MSAAALLLVCAASAGASALTLFSGFGLGTILTPVFALFFPVEAAVGLTAVVHLLNNLFKLALFGREADQGAVLRFGLPAAASAFAGAHLLAGLSALPALAGYSAFGARREVLPVKLAVGLLMIGFSLLESWPGLERITFERKWLPLGGVLSGFFGGLSGHQGALRSAFLVRAGLSKEAFVATGVAGACLVDAARLGVYARKAAAAGPSANAGLLAAAAAAAFAGAWAGGRLLRKATISSVRRVVSGMLLLLGTGLSAGLL